MGRNRRRTVRLLTSVPSILVAAVLSLAAASPPASAEGKQGQEREARRACLSGDYARGVAILSALFVDTKDPTFLFNQGRCFEQNRRYEDAIARFDEYLQTGDQKLTPADRRAAEQHIAHSKEMLAQERATSPTPVVVTQPNPPPVSAGPPAETVAPNPEPSGPVVTKTKPGSTGETPGSGLRIAGIVTASVGVAAVAAGVLFSLRANSLLTDLEAKDGYSSQKESDQKTYRALGWAGYGVGAACVVTGAILYGVGLSARSSASNSVAILPAMGTNQVGAIFFGGF